MKFLISSIFILIVSSCNINSDQQLKEQDIKNKYDKIIDLQKSMGLADSEKIELIDFEDLNESQRSELANKDLDEILYLSEIRFKSVLENMENQNRMEAFTQESEGLSEEEKIKLLENKYPDLIRSEGRSDSFKK